MRRCIRNSVSLIAFALPSNAMTRIFKSGWSKKKFQALALQFVDPHWKKNHVVTVGMVRSLLNKDGDVAPLWCDTMRERTGFELDDLMARMRELTSCFVELF